MRYDPSNQNDDPTDQWGNVFPRARPAFRQEVSRGSMTTMTNDPTTNAYMALFANARTPQEQADVRSRYAQALTANGPNEERRRFDLGREDTNRQFDARANMFRELLGRKMPDFSGGSAEAPPWMAQGGGGFGMASGGMGRDQGIDSATRNYLMRLLQGR